jgi:hypothetical protein
VCTPKTSCVQKNLALSLFWCIINDTMYDFIRLAHRSTMHIKQTLTKIDTKHRSNAHPL